MVLHHGLEVFCILLFCSEAIRERSEIAQIPASGPLAPAELGRYLAEFIEAQVKSPEIPAMERKGTPLGPASCSNPRTFHESQFQGLPLGSLIQEPDWRDHRLPQMATLAETVYQLAEAPGWTLERWYEFGDSGSDLKPEHCSWQQNVALYKRNDGNRSDCVLAFAGTDSHGAFGTELGVALGLGDWKHNKDKAVMDFCGFPGVHAGYAARMERFLGVNEGRLFQNLSKYVMDQCSGQVTAVGHSLGGALANLLAACLNRVGSTFKVSELYTFGAPGVTRKYKASVNSTSSVATCLSSGWQPQLSASEKESERRRLFLLDSPPSVAGAKSEDDEGWCEAVPLYNAMDEDGCFKGLRVFLEDAEIGYDDGQEKWNLWSFGNQVDPVPVLSASEGYRHSWVQALRLSCTSKECKSISKQQLTSSMQLPDVQVVGTGLLCKDHRTNFMPISGRVGFFVDGLSGPEILGMLNRHAQKAYMFRSMAFERDGGKGMVDSWY